MTARIRDSREWIIRGPVWSAVLKLAAPMLVSAMLQNLQSLIDLFWVGRLGRAAVAAVSMSGTVMMLLNPMIMGLATGTVAFVARATGGGDKVGASHAAGQSLFLSLVLGLVSAVVGWWLTAPVLRLLGASPEVMGPGAAYLRVCMAGSCTVFMLFIGNAALQGAGDTLTPMRVMALTNVLNIVLDPLLIYGIGPFPRMETAGAALATVLSQAVGAAWVIRLLLRGRSGLHAQPHTWRPDPRLSWRILRIGIPGSGQMLSRSLMSLVLMGIVALHGTAAVAAYGIGMRFHMITLMPAFALGGAAATLMGQNLGAGQPDRARHSVWTASWIDAGIMVLSSIVLMTLAKHLIGFFSGDGEVIQIGIRYLRLVSPFYVFAAFGIILARGLNGAGDTMGPMVITVLTLWGLQVPLAVYLSRNLTLATDGIWWAMNAAFVLQAVLTIGWFMTGRWRHARL